MNGSFMTMYIVHVLINKESIYLFIPYQKKKNPAFYVPAVQAFTKHCGKKRNCSERAISPFDHGVFYPFGECSAIFIKFKIAL